MTDKMSFTSAFDGTDLSAMQQTLALVKQALAAQGETNMSAAREQEVAELIVSLATSGEPDAERLAALALARLEPQPPLPDGAGV